MTRRCILLLTTALVLAACGDDDAPGDEVVVAEPQVGLGEEITYQGAVDTDAAWELSVVVDEVDCDIDVADEVELEAAEDRTCAVRLTLENTGDEPNIESFLQASSVITDDGATAIASDVASGAYIDEQGLHPSVGVAPGESVETAMLFTIPDGTEPAQLHLQAGAEDERVVVELGG